MRLIAERLLEGPSPHPPVCVQGEIVHKPIALAPLQPDRHHHLYLSERNPGSAEVGEELQGVLKGELKLTSDPRQLEQCEHMLLLLTSATWTRDEQSAAFAHEVRAATRWMPFRAPTEWQASAAACLLASRANGERAGVPGE